MSFCVIHQKKGAFLAQSRNQVREKRSHQALTRGIIIVKHVVAGLIYNNQLLFCLEDHGRFRHKQLSSYKVNITKDGAWELEADRHSHGELSGEVDTSAGMAIQVSGEVAELVLYSKRKILRYTLSKSSSGST